MATFPGLTWHADLVKQRGGGEHEEPSQAVCGEDSEETSFHAGLATPNRPCL